MKKRQNSSGQKWREQLAVYRDLSEAERRALRQQLQSDPETAERLADYEAMDRYLAELPETRPDPALRTDFYQRLESSRRRSQGWWANWRQLPRALGQLAAVVGLVLVVTAVWFLVRQQSQPVATPSATAEATGTPDGTQAVGSGIMTPGPTPTFAVEVSPDDPFAPFRTYMASWPAEAGLAYGSLRAGITVYLQNLPGGIDALHDPATMAALEAELRPYVPVWSRPLQLVDLNEDGRAELIVSILPLVEVYQSLDNGALQPLSLPMSSLAPAEGAFPAVVEAVDLTADGGREIMIGYGDPVTGGDVELVVAGLDDGGWRAWLRLPLGSSDGSGVQIDEAARPPQIITTCMAYGLVGSGSTSGIRQHNHYQWRGDGFAHLMTERTAPVSQQDWIDVGEAGLRQGHLLAVRDHYYAFLEEFSGLTPDPEVDWHAFVLLRLGQLEALIGEQAQADAYLAEAETAGGAVGMLAGQFRQVLAETDDPAAALASLLTLTGELPADNLFNQGANPDRFLEALYPGLALAAALNGRVNSDRLNVDMLRAAWAQYGLVIGDVSLVDMDGDGREEIVVVQPVAAELAPIWVLDQGPEGWFAARLGNHVDPAAGLAAPVPVPDSGRPAIPVLEGLSSWDGQLVHHYQSGGNWLPSLDPAHLCPVTFLPTLLSPAPPVVISAGNGTPTSTPYVPVGTPAPHTPDTTPTPTPYVPASIPAPDVTPTSTPAVDGGTEPGNGLLPVVDNTVLQLDSISPDGRFVAYWQYGTAGDGNSLPDRPGWLAFHDTVTGEQCLYPSGGYSAGPYGTVPAWRHTWLADGRLLIFADALLIQMSTPCDEASLTQHQLPFPVPLEIVAEDGGGGQMLVRATGDGAHQDQLWLYTPEPSREIQQLRPIDGATAGIWSSYAFSPAGRYVAVILDGGGMAVIDVAGAAVIQTAAWAPTLGLGNQPAPVWLDESQFLVPATADQGPLLVTVGDEVRPASQALFGLESAPGQFVTGGVTDGGNAIAILTTLEGDAAGAGVWLYHAQSGDVEVLAFDQAALDPTGRWLLLSQDEANGAQSHYELWRRPVEPDGAEPVLLISGGNYLYRAFAPEGGRLAVVRDNELHLFDPAGGHEVRTLAGYLYGGVPVWSPDGRFVVVVGGYSGRPERGLFVVPVEDG